MLGFDDEYLTGGDTSFIGPHAGCSTSVIMFRACTIVGYQKTRRTMMSLESLPCSCSSVDFTSLIAA